MARAGEEDGGIRKANSWAGLFDDRLGVDRRRAQPTSLPDEIRAAQYGGAMRGPSVWTKWPPVFKKQSHANDAAKRGE